ncbi:MAG: serine hydrolase [Planctomycetota bacterium]
MRRFALVLCFFVGSHACGIADDLAKEMSAYMEGCVGVSQFNGSVMVCMRDEVVFSGGFGMANFEHDVPNDEDTKFRIGSITKQFTAMAIMVLEERGKLDVNDPIKKYVTEAPEAWNDVTIHHLLTHTSGIPNYTSMAGYGVTMMLPQSNAQMMARFKDKPLEFEPGEKYRYSNSGYFLLGVLIERVSGDSYEEFLRDAVLRPLGLKDTGYDRFRSILKKRATGYTRQRNKIAHDAYLDMTQPGAAGAMYSTVSDLNRWDQALRRHELISPERYEAMYTPEKNSYAYGWLVRSKEGRKIISHGGGINGFLSHILRHPDQELCVVVLCNVPPADPQAIARDLAAIALGNPYEIPRPKRRVDVDPKVLKAYPGKYELGPGLVCNVTYVKNHLAVEMPGQEPLTFLPNSDTTFFNEQSGGELQFERDKEGVVQSLKMKHLGMILKAKRLPEKSESP